MNWRSGRDSGIYRKIATQAATWRAEGVDVGLFVATTPAAVDDWAVLPETLAVFSAAPRPSGRLAARERAAERARQWQPDVVYTRHGLVYPGLLRLAHRVPLVVEVNGDDLVESARLGHVSQLATRATRGFGLRAAAGLVFVTYELAGRTAFSRYGRRCAVISNGIDLSTVARAPVTLGQRNMIFLGHPGTSWHGTDKLLALAVDLPEWRVDIVGPDASEFRNGLPSNVTAHGLLEPTGYARLLAEAEVAVGSLAMHRAGIDEGCPLKVREYLAAGIPTVIAYQDTDFPDGAEFLLRLPNTPHNIVGAARMVEAFAARWRGRRIPREAVTHLDVGQKERARLNFIKQCVRDARGS